MTYIRKTDNGRNLNTLWSVNFLQWSPTLPLLNILERNYIILERWQTWLRSSIKYIKVDKNKNKVSYRNLFTSTFP